MRVFFVFKERKVPHEGIIFMKLNCCRFSPFLVLPMLLLISGWSLGSLRMQAQQEPQFAHYFELEPQFNPAAAGRTPELQINAAYQSHAMGYEDAGGTMLAMANMAFTIGNTRHGVGALFQNDEFGLFSSKRLSLQYAYHFRLLGGTFSVGAQVDMLNESVDGSKADLDDAGDAAFPQSQVSGSRFDASAGLYYQRGPLRVGLSSLHLLAPTVMLGETNEIRRVRNYYFTAGYNIKTRNPLFKIDPCVLLHYDGTSFRAQLTACLRYEREKKRFYGGASYSPQHSVTLFVGGRFHGVNLSYSYEAFTGGMGLDAGQHEVTLGYSLDLALGKRGRNYHKSVRWL